MDMQNRRKNGKGTEENSGGEETQRNVRRNTIKTGVIGEKTKKSRLELNGGIMSR